MLADVPFGVSEIRVVLAEESFVTTSFMDELVRRILVDGRAAALVLETSDEFAVELATEHAETYSVSDRLRICAPAG